MLPVGGGAVKKMQYNKNKKSENILFLFFSRVLSELKIMTLDLTCYSTVIPLPAV